MSADAQRLLKRPLGLVVFLVLWELVSRSGLVSADYLPPLAVIGSELVNMLGSDKFLFHLFTTWQRVLVGLTMAIAIGFALAVVAGRFAVVRRMLEPLVEMLRALPPPALVPLMIFPFGIGPQLFYFIVVFGSLWPVYINAANALATAEPVQVNTARSFGYSDGEILARVRLPAALPEIFTGIRLSAGIALLATIAGEMLVGDRGIGYLLYNAGFSMLMAQMYAIMFVIGISGILLNIVVALIGRYFIGWQARWSAIGDST